MNAESADTILLSNNVLTMSPSAPSAQKAGFVAIKGDRILAVGPRSDAEKFVGPATRRIDVGDRVVLPGFIDAHCHLETTARTTYKYVDVRTPKCRSIADVIATLKSAVPDSIFDGWLLAQANLFYDQKLEDKRLPTKKDLDQVSAEIPIIIRAGGHVSILNSAALRLSRIDRNFRAPVGATIVMGPDSHPNGILKEMDDLLPFPKLSGVHLRDAIQSTAHNSFVANGVTSICELSQTVEGLQLMDDLLCSGEMALRLAPYITVPRAMPLEKALNWREHLAIKAPPELIEIQGIKMFSDGGYSAASAAVKAPYVGPNSSGQMSMTREQIRDVYVKTQRAGMGLAIHANGEVAQEVCCEAVLMNEGNLGGVPLRLEHGGNYLPDYDITVDAWERAGIVPVSQPVFLYAFGGYIPTYLGEYGKKGRFPFRRLLDDGWDICGSSDSTSGAEIGVTNPMLGIWCAVARQSYDGETIDPEQKISVEDGLRMYTINSAKVLRQDHLKGSLEVGKLADVIVLDSDPRELAGDSLRETAVDLVFIGGKIAHQRVATR